MTNPLHHIVAEQLPQLPQVDFGDIVGSIALVATAITFFISYTQSSQSEQIKTSRELWAEINKKYEEFKRIVNEKKSRNEELSHEDFRPLLTELDYFAYLVSAGEIKDKVVVGYHRNPIMNKITEI